MDIFINMIESEFIITKNEDRNKKTLYCTK